MSVIYPTNTTNVSDSFQDHVNRGSVNPGTDYTAAYGSQVSSVSAGVVTDIGSNNSGSGGRVIHVNHDDGTGADYLHLSSIGAHVGQRVNQGEVIALSGASGYGQDWYYGPHLHISYRPNHSEYYGNVDNQDFDAVIRAQTNTSGGNAKPIVEEDDMGKYFVVGVSDSPQTLIFGGPGITPMPMPNSIWSGVLGRYADAMNSTDSNAQVKQLATFTQADWKLIRQALSNEEPSKELADFITKAGY